MPRLFLCSLFKNRRFLPFDDGSTVGYNADSRQGSHPASRPANKPQGVERMPKGMNAQELQELKAALLKAERMEMLAILRDAGDLQEAIAALEQRLKA